MLRSWKSAISRRYQPLSWLWLRAKTLDATLRYEAKERKQGGDVMPNGQCNEPIAGHPPLPHSHLRGFGFNSSRLQQWSLLVYSETCHAQWVSGGCSPPCRRRETWHCGRAHQGRCLPWRASSSPGIPRPHHHSWAYERHSCAISCTLEAVERKVISTWDWFALRELAGKKAWAAGWDRVRAARVWA